MVQVGTVVNVIDKTGVILGQCIKVIGSSKKRIAYIGNVIVVSVKKINVKKFRYQKWKKKKRFIVGTVHRALLVRGRKNFRRVEGIFLKFDENSVVFVNRNIVPVTNRVFGPILRELCMFNPSLGCVTRYFI